MSLNNHQCAAYKPLLVRYVDGELTPAEKEKLEAHLKQCPECRADLQNLEKWKEVNQEMKSKLLPDMAWEEYWQHIYNRLERGVAWILISLGAIIILGYAVLDFVQSVLRSAELTSLEKWGILLLSLGFVVLFISVLREKLMVRRHDKYRRIVR